MGFDGVDWASCLEQASLWVPVGVRHLRGKPLLPSPSVMTSLGKHPVLPSNSCDLCNCWLSVPSQVFLGGITVGSGIGRQRESSLGTLCSKLSLCAVLRRSVCQHRPASDFHSRSRRGVLGRSGRYWFYKVGRIVWNHLYYLWYPHGFAY